MFHIVQENSVMRTIILHLSKDGTPVNVPITAQLGWNAEWEHADVRFQNDDGDIIHYTVQETIPEINNLMYNPAHNS